MMMMTMSWLILKLHDDNPFRECELEISTPSGYIWIGNVLNEQSFLQKCASHNHYSEHNKAVGDGSQSIINASEWNHTQAVAKCLMRMKLLCLCIFKRVAVPAPIVHAFCILVALLVCTHFFSAAFLFLLSFHITVATLHIGCTYYVYICLYVLVFDVLSLIFFVFSFFK